MPARDTANASERTLCHKKPAPNEPLDPAKCLDPTNVPDTFLANPSNINNTPNTSGTQNNTPNASLNAVAIGQKPPTIDALGNRKL
eukprot:6212808-Pleurochrysis_carterae.AAC.3